MLTLEGGIPHKTVLSGTVARTKGKGSGVTTLGSIEGLGNFGDIRVKLTSPPFLVREYPFHDKGPHARGREIDCHTADMRLPFLRAPRAADSGTRTMSELCLTSHRPLARIMEVK